MKRHAWIILALGLGLAFPGCILTSGQIEISFELDDAIGISETGLAAEVVDLSTEEEYADNKDKLEGLTDLAVLGKITNNDTNPLNVEVWITPDSTNHATETQLKADPKAMKLWGPLSLAAGASSVVAWNESSKMFTSTGRALLLQEVKGDGKFTVYAIGSTGTYDFSIEKGVVVLVLDISI